MGDEQERVDYTQRNKELFWDRRAVTNQIRDLLAVGEQDLPQARLDELEWLRSELERDPNRDDRDAVKARISEVEEEAEGNLDDTQQRQLRRLRRRRDRLTQEIAELNVGLVMDYVGKFTHRSPEENRRDFIAAGMFGLMIGIDTYDPDRGSFASWAHRPIKRQVLRQVRVLEHQNMTPGDFERRGDILRAQRELQDGDPEAQPADEAVAERLGDPNAVDQVGRVLRPPSLTSMSAPIGDKEGDGVLGDLISDDSEHVEDSVLQSMNAAVLANHCLPELDDRELQVVTRRFRLDGEPAQTLASIGGMLNLSREAVRQIESKALSKLAHPVLLRRLLRDGRS